jgi:hypothetical protein
MSATEYFSTTALVRCLDSNTDCEQSQSNVSPECSSRSAVPQKSFDHLPEAYYQANINAPRPMQDRTPTERWQFDFAMWESASVPSVEPVVVVMGDRAAHVAIVHSPHASFDSFLTVTRLYAFSECEVIVDPVIDLTQDFSAGESASGLKWVSVGMTRPSYGREISNEALAKALEDKTKASPEAAFTPEEWQAFGIENLQAADFVKSSGVSVGGVSVFAYFQPMFGDWGFINRRPYGERGWCCAEFSVALKNNRIVNLQDPHVQQVLDMRRWPSTVGQYAAMMDGDAVRFTNKGDLTAVLYNFYKMTARYAALALPQGCRACAFICGACSSCPIKWPSIWLTRI